MGKVKKQKKWKSIKRTFMLYLPICAVAAYLGAYGIGMVTNELQAWYEMNYSDINYREQLKQAYEDLEVLNESGVTGDLQVGEADPAAGENGDPHETEQYMRIEFVRTMNGMTYYDVRVLGRFVSDNPWHHFVYNIISYAQLLLIPAWVLLCVGGTGIIFYKRELEKPIGVLLDASEKISDNCLDFEMKPVKQNELGQLCQSFENMRQALYENNQELWRTLEERKRLNAAFSHDIRTPLSVLKGYQEMLQNYVPEGRFSEAQLMEMIETMGGQIERLESYTQKMSAVQKLEDITPERTTVPVAEFAEQLRETGKLLAGELEFELRVEQGNVEKADKPEDASEQAELAKQISIDKELVLEVYENLVSNAVRYAKSGITVTLGQVGCVVSAEAMAADVRAEEKTKRDEVFSFVVEDDGPGFSEEALHRGTDPFYGSEKDGKVHFGLGLYICKTICEKHGGELTLENRSLGEAVLGSRVTARFGSMKNEGGIEK